MKLQLDPRLPSVGSPNYAQTLYARLYEIFRSIAQTVNGNADDIAANTAEIATLTPISEAQWLGKAVGEVFGLRDDLAGVVPPPTNNTGFRFVKLTAGDAYNAGALTGETVSGSAPLVVATAQIALAGSPLNGRTVNLLNTERRFLRAGSSGVLEDDAVQIHSHYLTNDSNSDYTNYSQGGTVPGWGLTAAANNQGQYHLATDRQKSGRFATETRPRDQGVTYYMRIL